MKNITTTKKQSLDDVLISFKHIINASLLKEARSYDLSLSHLEIIMYIANKGEVTMKDISSWLHITPPSVSTLIDILVKKNIVTRTQSKKDRRTVYITLNKEAHKLLSSIHKKKISMFKKMLSKLSNDDRSELIRILNKCIN